jgi:DNA-directed RNA polymerase specialized sigma24 family protein
MLTQELRNTDFVRRSTNAAKKLCFSTPQLDFEDLLEDTVLGIWRGGRQWPIEVEWNTFFFMTMMSVHSNAKRSSGKYNFMEDLDAIKGEEIERLQNAFQREMDEREFRKSVDRFLEILFPDEPEMLRFAGLRYDGVPKKEIMRQMALNETQYNTLFKRLRTALNRLSEKGKNS